MVNKVRTIECLKRSRSYTLNDTVKTLNGRFNRVGSWYQLNRKCLGIDPIHYRFYPECDVWLDHQSKVEDFSKWVMYSHAPGILIISRCFSTKNWFLTYPASIGDTLRNPPHYSDGRVKHHIQGRSDSSNFDGTGTELVPFQKWWNLL